MKANFDHCTALVREFDRDRFLATLYAPAEHRDALCSLYAFHIEIARIRNRAREPLAGEVRLQWWRDVLSGERDDEAAAHPLAAALQETIKRYAVAPDRLTAIADAHQFDLYDEPMRTLDDLDNYAALTQGAVFAIAGEILATSASAQMLTRHAGIAYCLAGILTGLAHDTARRQLFLPLEVLDRHSVKPEEIFAGQANDRLKSALAELRRHVRRQLSAAETEIKFAPSEILPALLPVALVGPLLRPMDRRGYEPFDVAAISVLQRQWLLWRAARDPKRIFAS